MIFIYGLIDPYSFKVRYIGKTVRLKERLQNQLNEKSQTYRTHWLQYLKSKGKKPIQVVLQTLPDGEDWQSAEKKWISVAKKYNWPLVNSTDGGDGVLNVSEESKKKMILTWKGRKHRKESIEKMRLANIGKKQPDSFKQHMSTIMKGRKIEWVDKISEANKKFDSVMIQLVKEELSKGAMVKDLALKYGVHRTTISKIKMNKYPK